MFIAKYAILHQVAGDNDALRYVNIYLAVAVAVAKEKFLRIKAIMISSNNWNTSSKVWFKYPNSPYTKSNHDKQQ